MLARRLLLLVSVVLLAATLSPAQTFAVSDNDTCNATAVAFSATDSAGQTMKPANWTNVPGASVTFVQGSTKGGMNGGSCALVRYTVTATPGAAVRANLDNMTIAIPAATGAGPGTREFAFPLVKPGTHTITMQIKGGFPGQTVMVADQIMVVQYAP